MSSSVCLILRIIFLIAIVTEIFVLITFLYRVKSIKLFYMNALELYYNGEEEEVTSTSMPTFTTGYPQWIKKPKRPPTTTTREGDGLRVNTYPSLASTLPPTITVPTVNEPNGTAKPLKKCELIPNLSDLSRASSGRRHIVLGGEMRTEEYLIRTFPAVQSGGIWMPKDCQSLSKLALIIPYRDREEHLMLCLYHLLLILQFQQIQFQIFIVEQIGNGTFNKGRLMNAGFQVAERAGADCVCFHDVDLVPENLYISYHCAEQPKVSC